MAGIYIHIPFCRQACSYCDFYFVTKQDLREAFVDRLCEEIASFKESQWSTDTFRTLYFGGGTPSRLTTDQLGRIFEALNTHFQLQLDEVTMEFNPEDVSVDYLKSVRELGVNRASMGIQTFDPDRLRFMNRAHSPKQARDALYWLSDAGFSRYTVDLIYGNPGQSIDDLERDIEELLAFNPPHVSAYALTVEPGTRLGKEVARGVVTPAEDDHQAVHFNFVGNKLAEAGLHRYEVSNYSLPGSEAMHNRNYWSHTDYLGLGPSAHSFRWLYSDVDTTAADTLTAANTSSESHSSTTMFSAGRRWKNRPDIRRYLTETKNALIVDEELLSHTDLAEERLMLGLRTADGVTVSELQTRYQYTLSQSQLDWLQKSAHEGYFRPVNDPIRLTDSGLYIADYLVTDLLARH